MPSLPTNFGLLEPRFSDYDKSSVAVLPVPFERTTSYGKGTAHGPAAILRASQAMELWDEQLGLEAFRQGIATCPPFLPDSFEMEPAMAELQRECARHMKAGKFLVTLGGEHSLTIAPVRAARKAFGKIGVVQFDAHADLREEFDGTPYSHASVMRRVHDDGVPALAVGIRSLSTPEAKLIHDKKLPVIWGHELDRAEEKFAPLLDRLPEQVYLTFDIDFFDPAYVPATGTPEPGGGSWYPTLALLDTLFRKKQVVAMDVVELAPFAPLTASDFLTAKLVYKCLGYRAKHRRRTAPAAKRRKRA
jgi:agmatinase